MTLASQLEAMENDEGIRRLLRGSTDFKIILVVDRGYVYLPNITTPEGQRLRTPLEVCRAMGADMIWRVVEGRGEYAFSYDEHRNALVKVEDNLDPTKSQNTGRTNTFARYIKFDL